MASNTVYIKVVTEDAGSSTKLVAIGDAGKQAGKKITTSFTKARRGLDSISQTLKETRQQLIAFFSVNAAVDMVRSLTKAQVEMQQIHYTLLSATGSADTANKAFEFVTQASDTMGLHLKESALAFAQLSAAAQANGVALAKQEQLFTAFGHASTVLHLSAQNSQSALMALQQMFSKGTVQAQELRLQLGQAIPGVVPRFEQAVEKMRKAQGKANVPFSKLLETGQLVTKDVLPALIEALEESGTGWKEAAQGLNANLARVANAWFKLKVAFSEGLNTPEATKGLQDVARLLNVVAAHSAAIVDAVVKLGEIVALVYAKKLIAWGVTWIANLRLQTTAVETETVAMTGLGVRAAETTAITKGALVAQSGWAAKTAGSFAAATKSIGKMGIAFNLLGSVIVGWQIGKYLRDQFLSVRLAAIAFVDGTLSGWEYIKYGAQVAWTAIKYGFAKAIEYMRGKLSSFLDDMASKAGQLPDWLGGSKLASAYKSLANAVRPTTDATADFRAEMAKLGQTRDADLKHIHSITDGMVDYQLAQEAAKKATKAGTQSTKENAVAQVKAAAAAAKAAAAKRAAAAAQKALNAARDSAREKIQKMAAANQDAEDKLAGMTQAQINYRHAIADVVDIYNELLAKGDSVADANEVLQQGVAQAQKAFHLETQAAAAAAQATDHLGDTQANNIGRANAYFRTINQGAQSMADAFAKFLTGTLGQGQSFAKQMVSLFKNMVAQIIAQWAKMKIFGPLMQKLMGGGQPSQGNLVQSYLNSGLGQLFFTNGTAQNGGGLTGWFKSLWGGVADAFTSKGTGSLFGSIKSGFGSILSTISGGFSKLWSGVSGMFGIGSAATAGTGSATAAAGAAAGVSWVPIVGWIVAGVLKNFELYKSGWSAGNPINAGLWKDSIKRGWFDPGAMATLTSDKLLRSLGLSDKWASILTGSSLLTKAWGHQAPHELQHGIDATFGAGGVDAQSYLDWKASGGWFTNADYGTDTQALTGDALASLNTMWSSITRSMTTAAGELGTNVDDVLKRFTANIHSITKPGSDETKWVVTYLDKTFEEATSEAAAKRIGVEGLLAVLQSSVGNVAKKMAAAWQGDVDALADGVQTMYAVQTDIVHGTHLLALGANANMQEVMQLVEQMQQSGEKLADTYQRLKQAGAAYLQFVAQFQPTSNTFGAALSGIAQQMQSAIDQANALARAAGLQGAREQDLANIHQKAAEQAAAAIAQLDNAAQQMAAKLYDVTNNSLQAVSAQLDKLQGKTQNALQLAIGDKSPLSTAEKLALALKGLRSGLTNADDVLSLGKKLYRGADYAGLYNKVQQIIGGPGAGGVDGLNAAISKYTDLYNKQQQLQGQADAMQRFGDAKTLAQYVADISTTHGIGYSEVAKNLGFSLGSLAKDLGVTNLTGYLDKLKLQDVAGTGLTDSGNIVTAIHQLGRDLIQSITGAPLAQDNAVLAKISTGTDQQTQLLKSIDQRLAGIENSNAATAKNTGDQAKTTRSLALRQMAAGTRTMPA